MAVSLLIWFRGHLALSSLLKQCDHLSFLLSQYCHFILAFRECFFLFCKFLFTLQVEALLQLSLSLDFLNSSFLFISFYLSCNLQLPELFLSFFFLKISHSFSLLFFTCPCLFNKLLFTFLYYFLFGFLAFFTCTLDAGFLFVDLLILFHLHVKASHVFLFLVSDCYLQLVLRFLVLELLLFCCLDVALQSLNSVLHCHHIFTALLEISLLIKHDAAIKLAFLNHRLIVQIGHTLSPETRIHVSTLVL